jgi:hypothetical protein
MTGLGKDGAMSNCCTEGVDECGNPKVRNKTERDEERIRCLFQLPQVQYSRYYSSKVLRNPPVSVWMISDAFSKYGITCVVRKEIW